MSPALTFIRIESLRARLDVASAILQTGIADLALLDCHEVQHLADAQDRIAACNVWLMTWRDTLEQSLTAPAPKPKVRRRRR